MSKRASIALVSVITSMIAVVVLLYIWDSGYEDEISEGITIGNVDVGGLSADAAASQLNISLVRPLDKDIVAKFGEKKVYKLNKDRLDVRADVGRMVDLAVEESRDGNLFSRSLRRIGGGDVDFSVEPKIAYSETAVEQYIATIVDDLDRDAQDAAIDPASVSLVTAPAKNGRTVDEKKLREDIEAALQSPTDRKIEIEVSKVKPKVTTDELADEYPTYITVDRSSFQLNYFENLELVKSYTIALGAIGYDTPSGTYHIQNKQVDPVWSVPNSDWAGDLAGTTVPGGVPENPLKARWMGIYDGVGIHGTSDEGSLGSFASHGCIRMAVIDVIDLYDRVPTGTPIYIS